MAFTCDLVSIPGSVFLAIGGERRRKGKRGRAPNDLSYTVISGATSKSVKSPALRQDPTARSLTPGERMESANVLVGLPHPPPNSGNWQAQRLERADQPGRKLIAA